MNVMCLGGLSVLFIETCTKPFRKITFLLVVCAFLIGCVEADKNDEIVVSDSATAINLTMPRSIVSRRIAIDEYSLTLSINSSDVPMVRDGERWVGDTFVPFGTELNVSVAWSARGVLLANLGRNYGLASSSNIIGINSSDYNYPDNDGDQLSNFSELNAEPETNPDDANSPSTPPIPIDPSDTSAISGVYDATLPSGDVSYVFISDSGTYEILDYRGDLVDSPPGSQFDDCWSYSSFSMVQNLGDEFYEFQLSFVFQSSSAIDNDVYFAFVDLENFALSLTSFTDFSELRWGIIESFYSDPNLFFPQESYCEF